MKRGARAARTLLRAQGVKADACAGAPLARLLFCSPAVQSCDAAARESWRLREVAWRPFSTDLRETATADVSTGPAHAPASLDDSASAPAGAPLVYEGALAETVRRVKLLSLTSLVLTAVGAPLLVHYSSPESVSPLVKLSLTASLLGFGFSTTALLQWFCSPYVLRLEVGKDDRVSATTLNVLARPTTSTFHLSRMQEPQTMRPLATFQVDRKIYFIDGTASDELLLRLGLKKTIHKPTEENDDED